MTNDISTNAYKNNLNNQSEQKFISVCIIGKPNCGKSTLLNQIIGEKISIVTPKVQTTRNIINGITIIDNTQIIFFDTPGIFEPNKNLEKIIVKCAWSALNNADLVLVMLDLTNQNPDDVILKILDRLKTNKVIPVFLLNKIDLIKNNDPWKEQIKNLLQERFPSSIIYEISAVTRKGVDDLLKYICDKAPITPWVYHQDDITTLPMRFLAAEITREQLFLNLHEELPYNLTVYPEKWEELSDKSVKIYQTILIAKTSHKSMILGKNGSKIKEIGIKARMEIEKNLELTKVHLFLFVKVRPEWMNNSSEYIG